MVRAVLFDFFGTLVDYAPGGVSSATDCAMLIRSFGGDLDETAFNTRWDATYATFEAQAQRDHREFSMDELARAFLRTVLHREPSAAEAHALWTTYVTEWNEGVLYRPDTPTILAALAERYRLVVVSNTHEPTLVPSHIEAMGIAAYFEDVVTSIGIGWRKPHPAIYTTALERLGIEAGEAAFVGDNYVADFQGPEAHGIRAYLLDPDGVHDIPADRRLSSLADLAARLR